MRINSLPKVGVYPYLFDSFCRQMRPNVPKQEQKGTESGRQNHQDLKRIIKNLKSANLVDALMLGARQQEIGQWCF